MDKLDPSYVKQVIIDSMACENHSLKKVIAEIERKTNITLDGLRHIPDSKEFTNTDIEIGIKMTCMKILEVMKEIKEHQCIVDLRECN